MSAGGRGRFADLLIAATAHAGGLDLSTRDAGDFAGLDGLVTVVALQRTVPGHLRS